MCFLSVSNSREFFTEFMSIRNESLSSNCVTDLVEIRRGIENRELWALKIQDASGRESSGFIDGNNFWLGSSQMCQRLNNPIEVPLPKSLTRRMSSLETAVKSKVPVDYRIIFASHTSNIQFHSEIFDFVGFHIAICLPQNCDETDVAILARSSISQNFNGVNSMYGTVEFVSSKNLKLRNDFFTNPWTISLM